MSWARTNGLRPRLLATTRKKTQYMNYTIVEQTSTVADLEISVLRCVAEIPKLIFSLELELQFLQVYHEVASSSQGKMWSQVERLSIMVERLSKFCKEAGLDNFEWTAKLCKNKLDTIRKRAKEVVRQAEAGNGNGQHCRGRS